MVPVYELHSSSFPHNAVEVERSLYSIYRHLQSSSRHLVRRRRQWLFDASSSPPPLESADTPHPLFLRFFFTIYTVIDTPLNLGGRLFQGFAHHWLLVPPYIHDRQRKTLCGERNDFLYGTLHPLDKGIAIDPEELVCRNTNGEAIRKSFSTKYRRLANYSSFRGRFSFANN